MTIRELEAVSVIGGDVSGSRRWIFGVVDWLPFTYASSLAK
jgi:hypothetical protein